MHNKILALTTVALLIIGCKTPVETVVYDEYKETYVTPLYVYPIISDSSVHHFKQIKKTIPNSEYFCANQEEFVVAVPTAGGNICAVSVEEVQGNANFYLHILKDGLSKYKAIIPDANYGVPTRYNFITIGDTLCFFSDYSSKQELQFNVSELKYQEINNNYLNWEMIDDWRSHTTYQSIDNKFKVQLQDATLLLTNLLNNQTDTIINQTYDGSWSFGRACWNQDGSKFYFDNSGAVACIWELDLTNKTLAKIVPEHWAHSPNLYFYNNNALIIYCEKSCIKTVKVDN